MYVEAVNSWIKVLNGLDYYKEREPEDRTFCTDPIINGAAVTKLTGIADNLEIKYGKRLDVYHNPWLFEHLKSKCIKKCLDMIKEHEKTLPPTSTPPEVNYEEAK